MANGASAGGTNLPTLTQIDGWDTTHLVTAAEDWTVAATSWESTYTAAYQAIQLPGGQPWGGEAAQAALTRAHSDRAKVLSAVDNLNFAATTAQNGAVEIDAARSRALSAIAAARTAGFEVDDELVVTDTRGYRSAAERSARVTQARNLAYSVWSSAQDLVLTDRDVATRLRSTAAGFTQLDFRESPITGPLPAEPPPPPVPTPKYQPKVWGACALRGADPNKVVRTFNRAPLSAGFRSLPGGDSQLYCGNDKYGFLHIADEHGDDWENIEGGVFFRGNWRCLADYAMASALAYPETVEYRQDNDTFKVTRAIAPTDGEGNITGPPTWRAVVVVSASDGKIITAFPESFKR
jgi:hypothetical protein